MEFSKLLDLENYPFQYSYPCDPKHSPPDRFFSQLPFRTSRLRDDFVELSASYDGDLEGHDISGRGHYMHWLMPECPPSLADAVLKICDASILWNDRTGMVSGLSDQHTADIQLALISLFKLGKPVVVPGLEDMEAGLQHFASLDKSYLEDVSSGIHEFTKARSLPIDNLTLDAYIEQRSVGFGLSVMVPWLRAAHEIEISTEEEKSIMQIIKKGSSVSALTNDYYSFHKEYDDAIGTGQSPKPYNAISVLMCDYAYSEDEAFQILKREILAQEVQLMEMVSIWLSAEQRSEDLRKLVTLYILACGGQNYWASFSPRYIKSHYVATKEERSHLVGPPGESIALQPLEYAESVPGKKYWSEFLRAMNVWLRLPAQSIKYMDTIFAHLCASSVM
ncbi:hypothetical protein AnigIFM63604_005065 [Aspergillus niger]|uniref:Uncharacterized protein n=1 Tax=Aspergillus niger TaxID=5061 RepID=A0A9W5ZX92_ASPNG|nr:hypothetical protein AnigIFM63604_005065 [Aspergillus niger]